jgi:CO/xanthine dehydrogenase FAD-binding subunit
MLILNLTALSNLQIRKMIWARCQAFGRVKGVSIHRRSAVNPRAYALVDMGSVAEAKRVIRAVGESLLGGSALIELTQDAPSADASMIAPAATPRMSSEARAELAAQAAIRSWLDTSARYVRQGMRVQPSL